jgi:PAS domain S-box-containing protein
MEQALRKSDARERAKIKELETILDVVPIPILIAHDAECKIITANRAGYDLLGAFFGAHISKGASAAAQPTFRIMADGVDVSPDQLPMQRSAANGKAIFGAHELITFEDGTERAFIVNAAPLLGEDGESYGAVAAVLEVTERKKAEEALRESQAQLAGIISSAMDAIITIDAEQRIRSFNEAAERMFGCSAEKTLGLSIERFIPERFHVQNREYIQRSSESSVSNRSVGALGELAALRANGEEFPIEASISALPVNGKKLFTVILRDITERKRAESAVRESEQRFRLVANTAPVLIWMSGPDKLCTYVNQPWLDFTGRPLEAELGNGWSERVHPDDLRMCLDTYTQAFDRREQFKMEYRLQRYDGEYRWVLSIGVPRFSADRAFAGYIGSCVDISERKLAEEVLTSVSRRLIDVQERERARISRELHDDIGQRLALLTVQLQQMRQALPDSVVESSSRIDDLVKYASEMSNDIQALSHELHSSKLEYLGVVAAMRGFCNEFSKQQGLEVVFRSHDLSNPLPSPEVSLSLYRVLQEALHNAAKHSGVRHFEVELWGRPGEIHLTVSDSGAGFDIRTTRTGGGLGLTSMRERLKLINGEISIESQPRRGTTIHASVPLNTDRDSKRAIG